jgi:fermentation-respiration switch protein FrsA (DUF1100 family)
MVKSGILVVADNAALRATLARWLLQAGYALELAENPRRAQEVGSKAGMLSLFRSGVQPFMRSVLALDPGRALRDLTLPVLIVSGGHDLQVGAQDAALLAAARPDAVRLDVPDMNHVLKMTPADPAGQQDAYSKPDLPLAAGVSDAIAALVLRSAH